MTALQLEQVAALRGCRLTHDERRFLKSLDPARELRESEAKALALYCHAYRDAIGRCLVPSCARCDAAARRNAPGKRVAKKREAERELQELLEQHNRTWE